VKAQVRILVYDPRAEAEPEHRTYTVPFRSGDKVLGALLYIHKNLDPCLSFRFNCRSLHCGECSMTINGKACLSCMAPMTRELSLEPLRNLPLIKDLVIDRNGVYKRVLRHLPPVAGGGGEAPGLRRMPQEVVDTIVRLDHCMHCLCCMAVCPAYKKEPGLFPGPIGLLALAAGMEQFGGTEASKVEGCLDCGRCEDVCPRHIPILSEAVQTLRKG
jgi:fumarate reductase (CoM/CoB) subunit B